MNATTKHLHALPFWDHLSDAEKDILCNNAYIRSFDRDSYILHSKAGEDIGLMMLIKGSVRAYLLSPDGRETTLFSLHDQSICIFSALSLFNQISFQVFLASDCCSKVLVVNMSIMKQLMQNNLYFRCFAYELIAERFNLVMGSMQRILFNSLEQRLAAFLVAEYNRCGKTHIQLTHNYIARYIGTSRERVTKTLKKLNEKKLLNRSKGCIELTDIDGLCALASPSGLQTNCPDFRPQKAHRTFFRTKPSFYMLFRPSAPYPGTVRTAFFIFITAAAPYYFIVSLLLMTDAE